MGNGLATGVWSDWPYHHHAITGRARVGGSDGSGGPVPLKRLLVPLSPIFGATIWIFGSAVYLPSSGVDPTLSIGGIAFVLGSVFFQASALCGLYNLWTGARVIARKPPPALMKSCRMHPGVSRAPYWGGGHCVACTLS